METTDNLEGVQLLTPFHKNPVSVSQRRDMVLSLVEKGCLLPEIVTTTGASDSAVRADLRKLGIDISAVSAKSVMSDQEELIKTLHDHGKSAKVIAMELGLSSSRVRYLLSKWTTPKDRLSVGQSSNLSVYPEDELLAENKDDAIRLILSGSKADDIGFVLRLSKDEASRLDHAVRLLIVADSQKLGAIISSHIVELAEAGFSSEQIAEASGINSVAIRRIGRKAGVRGVWLFAEPRATRIREAVSMLENGTKASEIASILGVTREMIRQDLLAVGVDPSKIRKQEIATLLSFSEEGKTASEISELMSISEQRVKDLARQNSIELQRVPYLYETHGTVQSYNAGCRCDECKSSSTARASVYKKSIRGKFIPDKVHGTVGGYTNWACRCTECKNVHSIQCKVQGERRRGGAPRLRSHFSWSKDADYAVMDYSKTANTLSREIGATEAAVHQRRAKLLREGASARNRSDGSSI